MSSHLNMPITANLIDAGSRQLCGDESPPEQPEYSHRNSPYRGRFDSGADTSLGTVSDLFDDCPPYSVNPPPGTNPYAQDTHQPSAPSRQSYYSERRQSQANMAVVRYPPPQDTYQTPIHFRDSYHSEQRPRVNYSEQNPRSSYSEQGSSHRRQSYLNPLPSQMPKGERPDYSDPERIPGLPPLSSLNAPMDHYDYVPAGPQAAGNLGREVMTVECPWCHYVVETHVKRSIGVKAGGAAVLAAAIAWPLFWVPLVVPGLHRKTHYCPQCKRKIGRGKRR